jgi:hypothetical protein
MLTSISWQQYLLASAIIVVLYYTVIILLYYRGEVRSFFTSKASDNPKDLPNQHLSILGDVRLEKHETSILSEELQFSSEINSNHI